MGIALEYAFLVAIIGGLAAIGVAHFLESIEDDELRDAREARPESPAPDLIPLRIAASAHNLQTVASLPSRSAYSARSAVSRISHAEVSFRQPSVR
jgi:hypothetical protein